MKSRTRHIFGVLSCVVLLGSVACESVPLRALRGAQYYARGSQALDRGESEVAIEALSVAAELVPQASEIQNHLGLAYWAQADLERARSAFERALEIDCENEAARHNRDRLEADLLRGRIAKARPSSAGVRPEDLESPENEEGEPHGGS